MTTPTIDKGRRITGDTRTKIAADLKKKYEKGCATNAGGCLR
jgi:hypothetical protein